jgi:hypothetical protein
VVGSAIHIQNNSGLGLIWHNGVLRNLNDLVPDQLDVTISAAQGTASGGELAATGANASGEVVTLKLIPVIVEGDAYPDCLLNIDDIINVILEWGKAVSPTDVTGDGTVDVNDLILVINRITR